VSDLVRINNTILSATSVRFLINGGPWEGILALDFDQKRTRKKVYGARRSGKPLGRTSGKYEPGEPTLTMLKDSYDALTTDLALPNAGSYGDAEFTLVAQWLEPVPSLVGAISPITLVLSACCISGDKDSYAEGVDEAVVEVTLDVMDITRNGKSLYSQIRG